MVPIAWSPTGKKGSASCPFRDKHIRHVQVNLAALQEVEEALGVAWHERRNWLPRVVCSAESCPLRLELAAPRQIWG